mgnify:CR=1 FL=1
MNRIPAWKAILIVAVSLLAFLYAAPNLLGQTRRDWLAANLPHWMPSQTVNLGLDLQCGSHLLLHFDVYYAVRNRAQFEGKTIVIAGGGDSALEAAATVAEESDAIVDLSYRGDAFGRAKRKNRTRVDAAIASGRLTVRLAEAFGFCWGVERAVAMAYETRRHYPTERIWITNEIIHNPSVNDHLREMNVLFISVEDGMKDFSEVASGDVVILPAFGATVQEMQLLSERGCHIVDTTCPWVSKVWNTVEKHKKHAFTSIIHGKVKHEETLATSSFAGTYLEGWQSGRLRRS